MARSTLPVAWSITLAATAQPEASRAVVAVPGTVGAVEPADPDGVDVAVVPAVVDAVVDAAVVEEDFDADVVEEDLAGAAADCPVDAAADDVGPRDDEEADEDEATPDDVESADAAARLDSGVAVRPSSPEQPEAKTKSAATTA